MVTLARDAEVRAFEQGSRPATSVNAPGLLVIGMDGGRGQSGLRQGNRIVNGGTVLARRKRGLGRFGA